MEVHIPQRRLQTWKVRYEVDDDRRLLIALDVQRDGRLGVRHRRAGLINVGLYYTCMTLDFIAIVSGIIYAARSLQVTVAVHQRHAVRRRQRGASVTI